MPDPGTASQSPGGMADAFSAKQKMVILAIDFGTSMSALQFVILEAHEIDDRSKVCPERITPVRHWPLDMNIMSPNDKMHHQVPTALLYPPEPQFRKQDPRSCQATVRETDQRNRLLFGYEVNSVHAPGEEKVRRRGLPNITEERLEYFKLLFQDDPKTQKIRDELHPTVEKLKSSRHISKSSPHVDLTEDYFVRLLRHADYYLKRMEGLADGYMTEIVLCVPVVFGLSACRDLQTALARALCLVKLGGHDVSDKWIPRFSMITEPEAGAECSLHQVPGIKEGARILVVDSGGGTCDVCAFQIAKTSPLRLEREDAPPTGDLCGSIIINGMFYDLMLKKLEKGAPYLKEYRDCSLEEIAREITAEQFEFKMKQCFNLFGDLAGEELFRCDGVRASEEHAFWKNIIRIPHSKIAEMFRYCLDKIWILVKAQLDGARQRGRPIDVVIMLGGLSRNWSYQEFLDNHLKEYASKHEDDIKLLGRGTDIDPTAIAKGAVLRALKKSFVPARALPSSYGILRHIEDNVEGPEYSFLPPKDKRGKSTYSYEDGRWYFLDRILWFAQKGEEVDSDREWTMECEHFFPIGKKKLICQEVIYISDTVRESGYSRTSLRNKDCPCIGTIEADMTSLRDEGSILPDQNGSQKHWRIAITLVIKIKGLDLEVSAKWRGETKGRCIINMAPSIVSAIG
ncbi:hypothetical protein PG995_007380 [Apiospora arundinis]